MNSLDIILLVPLLWGMIRGFLRGFILQLATIAAYLLGIMGAAHFSAFTADYLNVHWHWNPNHSGLIVFALLFIGIVVAVFFLGRVMSKAVKAGGLGIVDKLTGMVLGGMKFFLITGSLLFLVSQVSGTFAIIPKQYLEASVLAPYYIKGIKLILPALKVLKIGG